MTIFLTDNDLIENSPIYMVSAEKTRLGTELYQKADVIIYVDKAAKHYKYLKNRFFEESYDKIHSYNTLADIPFIDYHQMVDTKQDLLNDLLTVQEAEQRMHDKSIGKVGRLFQSLFGCRLSKKHITELAMFKKDHPF